MKFINLFYFFTIFIFTNILIKISIPLMGNIFKDVPNERSSHKYIKLKSGGIFFITSIIFTNLIDIYINGISEISKIIFLSTILASLGFIDDLFLISAKLRYFFQLLISTLITYIVNPYLFTTENIIFLIPLIFLGTIIINLLNFMDGVDGLLAGCALPILIYSQLHRIDIQTLAIIASLIAFLKWNWDPSKIFMGDCGSNFLGAFIFYLIINNNEKLIDLKAIFIISPLIIDSSFCIIRRLLNKENIFIAHKKHIYQRLYQAGISHSSISLIYIIFCVTNFLITFQTNIYIFINLLVIEIFAFLILDRFFAKKFY